VRRAILFVLIVCACVCAPQVSFTEDAQTVRLARVIYTLAGADGYEAKLAIGTVVMNRVESPWFPATIEGVLEGQQQFPCGSRYDADSLRAAHEVLAGARTLGEDALYYQAKDASAKWGDAHKCAEVGNFDFYTEKGR
jgi:N-acetylmuramoyl-L-alanine amidase